VHHREISISLLSNKTPFSLQQRVNVVLKGGKYTPPSSFCRGKRYLHRREYISMLIYGVHFAGLLDVKNILSADSGISWQTEGHSFGDDLISGSVNVTPSSVIELLLCSVLCLYDSYASMSNQPPR
jgi:hypothetical protein